jgi:hypothetical protein
MKQAEELRDLLEQCRQKDLRVSLIRGYGLDALYCRLTRDHKDFDFLVQAGSRDDFVELISQRGYRAVPGEFDTRRRKEAYRQPVSDYQAES